MWQLIVALVLVVVARIANAGEREFAVISPQVDEVLKEAPEEFWTVFGIVSLVLGAMFAFVGARMVRIQATFYAACLVGELAAYVIHLIDPNTAGGIWLGIVLSISLLAGYFMGKIGILCNLTMWLTVSVAMSGLFNQYLLSYFDSLATWVPWTVYICCCVLTGMVLWWSGKYAIAISTSFLGAFIVLLSSALLMDAEFSLSGMFGVDPQAMVACTTAECWGPLAIFVVVFVVGVRFQVFMHRRNEDLQDTRRVDPSVSSADLLGDDSTHSNNNPFTPVPNNDRDDDLRNTYTGGEVELTFKKKQQMVYV